MRILSDGEVGLRGVVGTWLGKKCEHSLDLFHVARRIGRIEKEFLYLPYGDDFQERLAAHWANLNSMKWMLWNDGVDMAEFGMTRVRIGLFQHALDVRRTRQRSTKFLDCDRSAMDDRPKRFVSGGSRGKHDRLRGRKDFFLHRLTGSDARARQHRDRPRTSAASDKFREAFEPAGHLREFAAEKATATLLQRYGAEPDIQKAAAEFDRRIKSKIGSLRILRDDTLPAAAFRCLLEEFKSGSFGRWRSGAARWLI